MDSYNSTTSVGNLATLLLLITGVLYLCAWSPREAFLLSNKTFSTSQNNCCQPSSITFSMQSVQTAAAVDELQAALDKASMPNKTVIITVVNKAYAEGGDSMTMLDLFLESFWVGNGTRPLLRHLLVVAVDQTAYDRCKFRGLHCYRLETDGVNFRGEKLYMSQDFINMMWRRTLFLLDVLKRGYSFIFTDTDIMWLRNPFQVLSTDQSEDLQISTDQFYGDPRSENNLINTGFYFIRSNNATIALFELWYAMKNNFTGTKEQDVLTSLMRKGLFGELDLKVRYLETLYFSGFCQDSTDFRAVTTVHANCCRSIKAKVADLRAVLRDWRRFKRLERKRAANETMAIEWSKHIACFHSWRS